MREAMLIEAAEEVAYRVRLYSTCEGPNSRVAKDRRRDILRAIDDLVKIY